MGRLLAVIALTLTSTAAAQPPEAVVVLRVDPRVSGALSAEAVRRTIDPAEPALRACVRPNDLGDPEGVTLELQVGRRGRVTRAAFDPPERGRARLLRCLRSATRRLRFDAAAGESTIRVRLRDARAVILGVLGSTGSLGLLGSTGGQVFADVLAAGSLSATGNLDGSGGGLVGRGSGRVAEPLRGRVTTLDVEVDGPRPVTGAAAAVRRQTTALARCWDGALRDGADAPGRLSFGLTVGPTGEVTAVEVTRDDLRRPGLSDCFARSMRDARFAGASEVTLVRASFDLSPEPPGSADPADPDPAVRR